MKTILCALAAGALSLTAGSAFAADAATDAAMVKLAGSSGCTVCHSVEPSTKAGEKPVGPAWRDVAARYAGNKDAQKTLTQTVMKGSNPYDSHWKGKAAGLAMPPNAVAINEADAGKLVSWILSLNTK